MKCILRKEAGRLVPDTDEATEAWHTVVGFPKYEVSNLGRIRRTMPGANTAAGKVLRWGFDTYGYPMVMFYGDGRRFARKVHRLVAEAFLGPRPSEVHEVAHTDGDKTNPKATNLRWATRAENHADKLRHGTSNRGERHGMSRLTTEQIRLAESHRARGATYQAIADQFGVNRETVRKALKRESWKWLA